ncbi:hypothetical protein HY374_04065 [Candidatus Berkelbacteria bacterium]|nr:hypothetical protein [Candidatus Berkelbacteria bacterium]
MPRDRKRKEGGGESPKNPQGKGELFIDLLAFVLGGLEPERRQLGIWLAGHVPEDHWLRRREGVRRAVSALNQWLERRGGSMFGAAGGQVYERLVSDVVDAVLQEVGGGKEEAAKMPPWIVKFLKEGFKTIATAPDPEERLEDLKRRFSLQLEFRKAVEEGLKPPEPEVTEDPKKPIDWGDKVFQYGIRPALVAVEEADAWTNEKAGETAPHVRSFREKHLANRRGARSRRR